MFDKKYDNRLEAWADFRNELEKSPTPFEDVVEYYQGAPSVRFNADPWDDATWPTPWELVFYNEYCDFCRVLGWCYSLQLTERFSTSNFEIHIITTSEKDYQYLLIVDDNVLGFSDENKIISRKQLSNYQSQQVYAMPDFH
jgi:hypothetical protein